MAEESKTEGDKEPKPWICTATIAITDSQDIATGKAVRKLAVGESFLVLEGPVAVGTTTRARIKAAKDDKEGWLTIKGNGGTVYAKVKAKAAAAPEAKKEEEAKEPEKPEEGDAPPDTRKKIAASAVGFNIQDATLNAMPAVDGRLLMSLSDGGLQYLFTSIRANAAIKSGRYMFEVRIVECLTPSEPPPKADVKMPAVKQLVRVGFSLEGSSLFLGDGVDNVSFESEGMWVHHKKRIKYNQKFGRNDTVAVMLNLDKDSPHANTVSLFKEGVRITKPKPLPENLIGKPLIPTITYKNVSLEVNFGPIPKIALPFTCRMLKDAAEADVDLIPEATGQCEAVFPIAMPDQGAFDWADQFLAANPKFTELSDRSILEWASKSGLQRRGKSTCNDKPEMNFGIPLLDDLSVNKVLSIIAPSLKRNYLIMELKANLVPRERAQALRRFSDFKKVATVIMGEPSEEYKAEVHKALLAEKVVKVEAEREKKAKEEERKRLLEEKKRRAEEAKKAKLAAQKKKEGGADAEEESKEDETKEEEKEEAKEEVKEEDKVEDEPIELTEEEKKVCHRKMPAPDLTDSILGKSYASFKLPSKDEGFDDIKYEWQPESECTQILTKFVHERKMTQKVEDLEPGEWFKAQWTKWQTMQKELKTRCAEYKDPVKRKALIAKKKKEAGDEEAEETEEAEKKTDAEAGEEEEEEVETSTVEDIMDIGMCKPLFFKFGFEDWTLLNARMELHLLIHGFNKDLDDPDRPSFKEKDFGFYYNKYFKKTFVLKSFGVEKFTAFVDFIKDTIRINAETGFLESKHPDDTLTDVFVKLAEEHRREIERRVDAGDETAKLKFVKNAAPVKPAGATAAGKPASATAQSLQAVTSGLKRPMPGAGGPRPAGIAPTRPRVGGFYGR